VPLADLLGMCFSALLAFFSILSSAFFSAGGGGVVVVVCAIAGLIVPSANAMVRMSANAFLTSVLQCYRLVL
jgi:hypothetical protein